MEQVPSAGRLVQITVTEGYDLKGFKGDTPVTFIRAEFNQVVLGDSAKITVSPEGSAKYNFTSSFEFNPEGGITSDDLAHKPVFLTVTEVLPKEKKQKEEKTLILGQAVVDLLPLLEGPGQNYMVGLQVPSLGEKDYPILFKNGTLKLGGEREPVPRPKKWPIANILAPGANNIPDAFIVGGPYEEEEGELNHPEVRA